MGGGAIWSMHFIAMLAFRMPMKVSYDLSLTLASLVLAMLVTGAGLFIVGRGKPSLMRLLGGGTLTGLGVATMHDYQHPPTAGFGMETGDLALAIFLFTAALLGVALSVALKRSRQVMQLEA
jgi:NO-binding membrane sensor protein with MHYT domain